MSSTTPTTTFRLHNGDHFPEFSADLVGGGTLNLPGDLAGSWGVVLFNRGRWCPFCQTQLAGFQKQLDQFAALGVTVVSLSADAEAEAAATVADQHLTFPVAYGVDPSEAAETLGTYISDGTDGHPVYTQATGFILTPDSSVAIAVYSSGAIGRLTAADTLGMIKYAQSAS